MNVSGVGALLEMLANLGVRYLFGNPGTTELPLSDRLVEDRRIEYMLGLQEVPVVAMADGYAQASRSLGVVNLHISCGLGNAMGMLYNAHRAGTPLLVTAGQQDRRLKFEEPILWSDMVRVAEPWTKWAAEVRPRAGFAHGHPPGRTDRAYSADRSGVSLAADGLAKRSGGARSDAGQAARCARVRPPLAALRAAAEVLASAQ